MERNEKGQEPNPKPYMKPVLVKEKQLREITAGDLYSGPALLGCTKQLFGI